MLTINKLLPQGHGLSSVLRKRAPTVQLDWDVRQKSRFDATDSQGRALGVFLPHGTVVRGGDVLVAEDGSLVLVQAAEQPVMVVTACPEHGSAFDLVRAAYHLGNRHVALELQPDRLQFEPDHVLADMLSKMHLIVTEANAPFEPEGGAYAAGGHAHGHAPSQTQTRTQAPTHEHGPGCSHDHDDGPHHEHAGQPAAAPRGKPVAIAVVSAPAPQVHGHGHSQGHVHGPGCNHDHDHSH
jgi:urease accessory protein